MWGALHPLAPSAGRSRAGLLRRPFAVGVVALAGLGACGRLDVTQREGGADVYHVEADDPEMNRAMEAARASIADFVARLEHPPKTQTRVLLKVRVQEGDVVEHLWLENIRRSGEDFSGEIGNEPLSLVSVKLGDRIEVPLERVSDWAVVDAGRLVGGTTLRLLRARASPSERAAMDEEQGFIVD